MREACSDDEDDDVVDPRQKEEEQGEGEEEEEPPRQTGAAKSAVRSDAEYDSNGESSGQPEVRGRSCESCCAGAIGDARFGNTYHSMCMHAVQKKKQKTTQPIPYCDDAMIELFKDKGAWGAPGISEEQRQDELRFLEVGPWKLGPAAIKKLYRRRLYNFSLNFKHRLNMLYARLCTPKNKTTCHTAWPELYAAMKEAGIAPVESEPKVSRGKVTAGGAAPPRPKALPKPKVPAAAAPESSAGRGATATATARGRMSQPPPKYDPAAPAAPAATKASAKKSEPPDIDVFLVEDDEPVK
jgi:hypothetical protein